MRKRGKMKRALLTIVAAMVICLPAVAAPPESTAVAATFKLTATFDAQVTKDLWDEFGEGFSGTSSGSVTRVSPSMDKYVTNYPEGAQNFWMRIALFGTYRTKNSQRRSKPAILSLLDNAAAG